MAYETGSATGVNDLVNKLATFIEANGWTRDSLGDEGTGRRYHAHNGSVYVNMRSFNSEAVTTNIQNGSNSTLSHSIAFNVGSGYSGASAWYNQAGTPQNSAAVKSTSGVHLITGAIPAYHFFAHNAGDNIFVVIEYASGMYQRFGFGTLTKYGSYTGGEYMVGNSRGHGTITAELSGIGFFRGVGGSGGTMPAYVNVDVDAESGWHYNSTASYGATRRPITEYTIHKAVSRIARIMPNTHNGLVVKDPVIACVERSTTSDGIFSPIGELPGVFYTSLANLVPSQQVTFGSEDYRVFPFLSKATTDTGFAAGSNTGWSGFAVKE
jgi:hypothetical protein